MKNLFKKVLEVSVVSLITVFFALFFIGIATGATVLFPSQGGTGTSTKPSAGAILYGISANQYGVLTGGATGTILQMVAGKPAWSTTSTVGGIYSLNTLTTSSQVFATGTDTNIVLVVSSTSATHTLTPGWTGVLGFNRGGTATSTSFTTGSILFSDGTSFSQNNSNLFWDNSLNRLGIGTTTPTVALSVVGDIVTRGPWRDVRSYGAKCDGVTDDKDAIQAAIDVGVGSIFIPSGTCMLSGALQPTSTQHIYGVGSASILKSMAGVDWGGFGILYVGNYDDNLTVSDLTFDGNKANNPTGRGIGIKLLLSSNIIIRNVVVKNHPTGVTSAGDGIYIDGGSNILIDGVTADNNDRQGLSLISGTDIRIVNSLFMNTTGTNPGAGIDIEPDASDSVQKNILIQNNTFKDNKIGILLYSTDVGKQWKNIVITGNTIYNSTVGEGIILRSIPEAIISNNVISSSTRSGIKIYGDLASASLWEYKSSGIKIFGNTIQRSGQDGILVEDRRRFSIENNTIVLNGENGIKVASSTAGQGDMAGSIIGNTILNNSVATSSAFDGILFTGAATNTDFSTLVSNNTIGNQENLSTSTQRDGIRININADNVMTLNNRFVGNLGSNITNSAASSTIMYVDNGRFDIGGTAPTSTLQVSGILTITEPNGWASTAGRGLQIRPTDATPIAARMVFGTDGSGWQLRMGKNQAGTITDIMTIQDNSRVGIATTTPAATLHVDGDIYGTNLGATGARFTKLWTSDLDATQATIGTLVISSLVNGNLVVGGSTATSTITNNGTLSNVGGSFQTASSTYLAVSTGNVGIGTSTPQYKLDLQGDLRVNTSSTLGNVISGVWNGTAIGEAYTASSSYQNVISFPLVYASTTHITATTPLSLSAGGILSMPTSTTAQNGFLTSTDWTTFNNKESALTFSTGLNRATNTITNTGVLSLTATANQTTVSNATGTVTIGTAQSIGTASTPQFAGLGLGTSTVSGAIINSNGAIRVVGNTNPVSGKGLELQSDQSQIYDHIYAYDRGGSTARNLILQNPGGSVGIGAVVLPLATLHVLVSASSTIQIGGTSNTACLTMGDSDGSGLTYITAANGVLSATTTKPTICQ